MSGRRKKAGVERPIPTSAVPIPYPQAFPLKGKVKITQSV